MKLSLSKSHHFFLKKENYYFILLKLIVISAILITYEDIISFKWSFRSSFNVLLSNGIDHLVGVLGVGGGLSWAWLYSVCTLIIWMMGQSAYKVLMTVFQLRTQVQQYKMRNNCLGYDKTTDKMFWQCSAVANKANAMLWWIVCKELYLRNRRDLFYSTQHWWSISKNTVSSGHPTSIKKQTNAIQSIATRKNVKIWPTKKAEEMAPVF